MSEADVDRLSFLLAWWCIGGVVGALLGSLKGRPVAGFMWGFLFGPLGWLIAFMLSTDSKRQCPACHGILPDATVTKCKHCGSAVKPHRTPRTFGKRPKGYTGAQVIVPEFDEERL